MDPLITSAAITGIGSLAGSLFTNQANYQSQQLSYAQQRRLMKYQYELQQRGIDAANFFNLPENQMRRLANAGLNPHLVYNGNVDGNQSSAASASLGHTSPAQYEFGNPIGDAIKAYYGNKLSQSQIDSNEQGIEESYSRQAMNEEKTLGIMLDNRFKDSSMESRIAEQMERVANLRARTEKTKQETENLKSMADNIQLQGQLLLAKIDTEKMRPEQIREQMKLWKEQRKTTRKQREVMNSIISLNNSKQMQLWQWCAESVSRANLNYSTKSGKDLENEWNRKMQEIGLRNVSVKDFMMILKDIIVSIIK